MDELLNCVVLSLLWCKGTGHAWKATFNLYMDAISSCFKVQLCMNLGYTKVVDDDVRCGCFAILWWPAKSNGST